MVSYPVRVSAILGQFYYLLTLLSILRRQWSFSNFSDGLTLEDAPLIPDKPE
jgi:hypothetical protein